MSRCAAGLQQQRSNKVVFEKTSIGGLLDQYGVANADEARDEGMEWLADLAEQHPFDTDIYRSDFVAGGHYRIEAIDEFEAYKEAIAKDLSSCLLQRLESQGFNPPEDAEGLDSAPAPRG